MCKHVIWHLAVEIELGKLFFYFSGGLYRREKSLKDSDFWSIYESFLLAINSVSSSAPQFEIFILNICCIAPELVLTLSDYKYM